MRASPSSALSLDAASSAPAGPERFEEHVGAAVLLGRRDSDEHVGAAAGLPARPAGARRARRSPAARPRRSGDRRCWCGRRGACRAPTTARWRPARPPSGPSPTGRRCVNGSRMAGTPARWHSACRSVAPSLPAAANSGQTRAIGSSSATRPASTSCRASSATKALPTE